MASNASFCICVFAGSTPFARRAIIDFGSVRSCMAVNTRIQQGAQFSARTSTPRPSLSLCDFVTAGPGSAPSSGGFEAVLFRGGMVAARLHYGILASTAGGLVRQLSPGDGKLMAVAMWRAINWSGRHVSDAFRVRRCGSGGGCSAAENLRTLPSDFLYLNLLTLPSRTAALFRRQSKPGDAHIRPASGYIYTALAIAMGCLHVYETFFGIYSASTSTFYTYVLIVPQSSAILERQLVKPYILHLASTSRLVRSKISFVPLDYVEVH